MSELIQGMALAKANRSSSSAEGTMRRNEKSASGPVEYWRWRYRDAQTGRICRTTFQLRAEQAVGLIEAERIPGTLSLRNVDDFEDTMPAFFELDALGRAFCTSTG